MKQHYLKVLYESRLHCFERESHLPKQTQGEAIYHKQAGPMMAPKMGALDRSRLVKRTLKVLACIVVQQLKGNFIFTILHSRSHALQRSSPINASCLQRRNNAHSLSRLTIPTLLHPSALPTPASLLICCLELYPSVSTLQY